MRSQECWGCKEGKRTEKPTLEILDVDLCVCIALLLLHFGMVLFQYFPFLFVPLKMAPTLHLIYLDSLDSSDSSSPLSEHGRL